MNDSFQGKDCIVCQAIWPESELSTARDVMGSKALQRPSKDNSFEKFANDVCQ
jgi:hypothetical protein